MELWPLIFAFGVGWAVARLDDILNTYRTRVEHKERMLLFDKALSGGNPVDLYNLRVADSVSQRKETIQAATMKEVGRATHEEEPAEPWANDPLYGRCEVSIDMHAGVFHIFDPLALDGPDTWTEEIGPFMSKWEGEADSIVGEEGQV